MNIKLFTVIVILLLPVLLVGLDDITDLQQQLKGLAVTPSRESIPNIIAKHVAPVASIKQNLQALSYAAKSIRKLLSAQPFPREHFHAFFDTSSLMSYLLTRPAILKFLYRNSLISDEDLRSIGGNGLIVFKKMVEKHGDPNAAIDELVRLPYMLKLSNYYRDNLMVQGTAAAVSLAGLGGLHYYNQWPLRSMERLLQQLKASDNFTITLPMLQGIKNDTVFWQKILALLGHSVALNDVWNTLEKILKSSDKGVLKTLIFLAIERLRLMHGLWKYSPAGLYRKAEELVGDIYDYFSVYQPTLKKAADWAKKRIIGEPKE